MPSLYSVINEEKREQSNTISRLKEKNKELQERNDRQAERLDQLYKLIEKEDWETLSNIVQDFKDCEKQLQLEWETYAN